ncbi:MAG: hypothetical protein ACXVIB_02025 [Halobacteriota archaeon]
MLAHDVFMTEIPRSKISLHRAKKGYHYPTVRLPHQFSCLAWLSTFIYQLIHKGALAFLVVFVPADVLDDVSATCRNDSVF